MTIEVRKPVSLVRRSISDELFPVVPEYLEGCEGMAREASMRKGMEMVK
jgi:hypothetical protein